MNIDTSHEAITDDDDAPTVSVGNHADHLLYDSPGSLDAETGVVPRETAPISLRSH